MCRIRPSLAFLLVCCSATCALAGIGFRSSGSGFESIGAGPATFVSAHRVEMRFANTGAMLAMRTLGASAAAHAVVEARGADTALPTRVRYREILPGVDVAYYWAHNQPDGSNLEYDFILAPHANLRGVRLAFEGARYVRVAPDGDLVLGVRDGEVRQTRPVAFQNGRALPASFRLDGNLVSFEVPGYNPNEELIIDPVFRYASFLGGSNWDYPRKIATDTAGRVFIVGETNSPNFPVTADAPRKRCGADGLCDGLSDMFVTRLGPNGALEYSTYLGGNAHDTVVAIALGAAGEPYVAARTSSTDLPLDRHMGPNAAASPAARIVKLAPDGSVAFSFGFTDEDARFTLMDFGVDAEGFLYLLTSLQTNRPPASSKWYRISPDGSRVLSRVVLPWVARSMVVSPSGGVTLVGDAQPEHGLVASGGFQVAFGGVADGFVASYNSAGRLLASSFLGGPGYDRLDSIEAGPAGDFYVTGFTEQVFEPMLNPLSPNAQTTLVARISPDLRTLSYVVGLGTREPASIKPAPDGALLAVTPGQPGRLYRLNAEGSAFSSVSIIPVVATQSTEGVAVAADSEGRAWVTSWTSAESQGQASFMTPPPTTPGAAQRSSGGAAETMIWLVEFAPPTLMVGPQDIRMHTSPGNNGGFTFTVAAAQQPLPLNSLVELSFADDWMVFGERGRTTYAYLIDGAFSLQANANRQPPLVDGVARSALLVRPLESAEPIRVPLEARTEPETARHFPSVVQMKGSTLDDIPPGASLTFDLRVLRAVVEGAPWLTQFPSSTDSISLRADARELPSGIHVGYIRLERRDNGELAARVPVFLTWLVASLQVLPGSLDLELPVGSTDLLTATVLVNRRPSARPVGRVLPAALLSKEGDWFRVLTDPLQIPGPVTIEVSAAGLPAGLHQGSFTLSTGGSGNGGGDVTVRVTLNVVEAPLLSVSAGTLHFRYPARDPVTIRPPAQEILIDSGNGTPTQVSLISWASDYSISPRSGMTPLRVRVERGWVFDREPLAQLQIQASQSGSTTRSTRSVPLVFSIGEVRPRIDAVVDPLTGGPLRLTPGSYLTILGESLGAGPWSIQGNRSLPDRTGQVPQTMVSVLALRSVTASRIEAFFPLMSYQFSSFNIAVSVDGNQSNTVTVPVVAAAPALPLRPGGQAVAWNADGAQNSPEQAALPGSLIRVRCFGLGNVTGANLPNSWPATQALPTVLPVTAQLGSTAATVVSSTLEVGAIGSYIVEIRLPAELAPGDYPLQITADGTTSGSALISVGR